MELQCGALKDKWRMMKRILYTVFSLEAQNWKLFILGSLWFLVKCVCIENCIYSLITAHLHYPLMACVALRELPDFSELWCPHVKIGSQFSWTHRGRDMVAVVSLPNSQYLLGVGTLFLAGTNNGHISHLIQPCEQWQVVAYVLI